jgi:hypothetical protein
VQGAGKGWRGAIVFFCSPLKTIACIFEVALATEKSNKPITNTYLEIKRESHKQLQVE